MPRRFAGRSRAGSGGGESVERLVTTWGLRPRVGGEAWRTAPRPNPHPCGSSPPSSPPSSFSPPPHPADVPAAASRLHYQQWAAPPHGRVLPRQRALQRAADLHLVSGTSSAPGYGTERAGPRLGPRCRRELCRLRSEQETRGSFRRRWAGAVLAVPWQLRGGHLWKRNFAQQRALSH